MTDLDPEKRPDARDLLADARVEIGAMAKQGMAHPSTRPVLAGAAVGAVAGVILPFVGLPIGAVAGAGYALYRRLQR